MMRIDHRNEWLVSFPSPPGTPQQSDGTSPLVKIAPCWDWPELNSAWPASCSPIRLPSPGAASPRSPKPPAPARPPSPASARRSASTATGPADSARRGPPAPPRERQLGGDISPDDSMAQIIEKIGYTDAKAAEETVGQWTGGARPPGGRRRARPAGGRLRRQRQRVRRHGPAEAAPHRTGLLRLVGHARRAHLRRTAGRRRGDRGLALGATTDTVEALREASRRRDARSHHELLPSPSPRSPTTC